MEISPTGNASSDFLTHIKANRDNFRPFRLSSWNVHLSTIHQKPDTHVRQTNSVSIRRQAATVLPNANI